MFQSVGANLIYLEITHKTLNIGRKCLHNIKFLSFQKVSHHHFHNVTKNEDILQRFYSTRPKIRIYLPSIRDDDAMVTTL